MTQTHASPVTASRGRDPGQHDSPYYDSGYHDTDTSAGTTWSHLSSRRLLQCYLADHEAASGAGVDLVRRVHSANRATVYGEYLAELQTEAEEDRASLIDIMRALHIAPNPAKQLVAKAAAVVHRVKPKGQLHGYSPLTRVLELEALCSAVLAKRGLWQSLRVLAPIHPELDVATLDRLIDRATEQVENLTDQHRRAAREAFGG